ncbi:peptide-methionine (S)-S-oxide reductase MsrA [Sulfurimonas aquatica]|uniref:Peptide methionine sulfoxide reductase MsrA n=1 Tax=Sulfurimonas aquatica TaxID=2672570 RepID=A0A975AXY5_9BACT|nr:peptide-methionine (S)-S-oxide reductase MsrA [Sulfurimonas aquatica]QSZ40589.1 peptide-methionine (S)-S-oxide reductase MsrA [Sulfurimonas aquatica]
MIAEIVFAAGCFWGVEKHFESLPGVVEVKSGYSGGSYKNPDYESVLEKRRLKLDNGEVNHTEAVLVKFDMAKTDAKTLIKSFWEIHDPTQVNGQGNDIGNNYRSAIYYTNQNQAKIAQNTKDEYQKLLTKSGYSKIVTEIKPLEKFYTAETYHQDYLTKNPFGYCPNHATGVKFEKETQAVQEKVIPLGSKEILVIEAEGYCPYCEKFDEEVSSLYKGTIPLRTVTMSSLEGFDISTALFATPTILFIEDGKEIMAHRGYMESEKFYKTLGDFKLGKNSESYKVAFDKGTDYRFCKQYDIFKDTPDGVFVDKLSGDVLFDTRDRFDSGTGWLSFYKAVNGNTVQKEDNSFGMKRVEIVAKKSGAHLGHVFDREDGRKRFCINATVLEFVPRAEIGKKKSR